MYDHCLSVKYKVYLYSILANSVPFEGTFEPTF